MNARECVHAQKPYPSQAFAHESSKVGRRGKREEERQGRQRPGGWWSYNETGTHKKCRIAHTWVFTGTASAPFVPAQGLRSHGNSLSPHSRPLSTAALTRTIGKLSKHHASASAKSPDVNSTGDFTGTLLESALTSNPTLTGGVSATLAPCLSQHVQPAATLLSKGHCSVVCLLTILLF